MVEDRDFDHNRVWKPLHIGHNPAEYCGVGELFQLTQLRFILKHNGTQRPAINATISQHFRPSPGYAVERRPIGLENRVAERIGIDSPNPKFGQKASNFALPAADTAREQPSLL
jgi:hypothetical protein